MIKSLTEMNLQLLSVHEKKKALRDIDTTGPQSQNGNVTNNAIFVGTTKELHELIMKRTQSNV